MSNANNDDKSEETQGPQCDLHPLKGDKWNLEFVLKLKVFKSVWTPKYCFILSPVPLEQVDILASKVRDLEEQINSLRPRSPVYFEVTAKGDPGTNRNIVWNGLDTDFFKFEASGEIKFLVSGHYLVHAIIHCTNSNNAVVYSLKKGTQCVKSCIDSSTYDQYNGTMVTASPLTHNVIMAKNEKLSLMYSGNGNVRSDSYMMAFLICEQESRSICIHPRHVSAFPAQEEYKEAAKSKKQFHGRDGQVR